MAGVGSNHGESQDFTQPWKFSDVVLVVEDQKFHVHRAVLAVYSPVFEEMFTSEFQWNGEKEHVDRSVFAVRRSPVFEEMFTSEFQWNGGKQHLHRPVRAVRSPVCEEMFTSEIQGNGKKEIPIPGKMASEIMELLQIIYPSVEEKLTEENCYRLLRLADDYKMKAIVHRCETFIVEKINKSKQEVLVELVFAQTYNLQKLKQKCIQQAQYFSLEELKNDNVYDQIHFESIKDIMEGIIMRLPNEASRPMYAAPRLTAVKAATFPMTGVRGNQGVFQDFTRPWKFSDVVLVAGFRVLHVHRAVLAVFSPVFEEMFTTEIQGNGKKEISIPEKWANDIIELLQMIYPSVGEKLTEENCHRLLELAHQYQMKVIVQRCENFIIRMMNLNSSKKEFLRELVFAEKYNLQKLKHESIKQAQRLTLEELKRDVFYRQIQAENLKEIMEGMILLLQRPRSSF